MAKRVLVRSWHLTDVAVLANVRFAPKAAVRQIDSRRRIETWAERGRVTTSRQKNFRRRDTGSSRTGVPADRSVLSRGRSSARARFSFLRAVRQCPIRPNEVTGVAVRIFLQIILMLGFGLPERSGGCHLGDNLA